MSIGICTACSHLLIMWRWRYWSQRRNLIGAHWCLLVPSGARWWGTKRTILTPAGTRWPPFGTRLITTVSWANNFELDYFSSNIEKRDVGKIAVAPFCCHRNSKVTVLTSKCLQHTVTVFNQFPDFLKIWSKVTLVICRPTVTKAMRRTTNYIAQK